MKRPENDGGLMKGVVGCGKARYWPAFPLGGRYPSAHTGGDEGAMTGNFPGKLVLSLRQTDFQTLRAMKIGPLPCGGHASSAIPQGHWLHNPLVPRGVSLAPAALCPHAPSSVSFADTFPPRGRRGDFYYLFPFIRPRWWALPGRGRFVNRPYDTTVIGSFCRGASGRARLRGGGTGRRFPPPFCVLVSPFFARCFPFSSFVAGRL